MKIILEILKDKGSAKKGYIGEYGKDEAERLIKTGVAKRYAAPKTKLKPSTKKEI